MIAKLAWRNVWRNKVRSLVVIVATTLGISGALFIAALISGMMDKWVQNQIETELSDIQIHQEDFVIQEDQKFFFEKEDLERQLSPFENEIKQKAYRIKAEGLAMSAHNTYQVILLGVDPDQEPKVTNISTYIREGEYFKEPGRIKQILISQKLADQLKVRMNSKVVINLSDIEGEIVGEAFKVVGIFKTSSGIYDESHVFVRNDEFAKVLKMKPGQYHELAIRTDEEVEVEAFQIELQQGLDTDLMAESWIQMSPALKMTEGYMDTFNWILLSVVLTALIFGIINTMLMVVLERTREIGMLRSLGLNDRKVGLMFILETIYLSITGAIVGNILSFFLINYFGNKGIHFESWQEGFEAYGLQAVIYPILELNFYVLVTLLVFFTGLLASYFPVRKAIRLDISTAIRN